MRDILLTQAENHAKAGRYNEAQRLCDQMLRRDANYVAALFLAGTIAALQARHAEAKQYFDKVLMLHPEHVDAMQNRALLAMEADRDFALAESLFNRVLAANPRHSRALVNLGNLYLASGKYDLAATLYERAYAVNPGDVLALNNLGALCSKQGRRKEAIEYYRKSLKVGPGDPEVLSNLISVLRQEGCHAEALSVMAKVLKLEHPGAAIFSALSLAKMHFFPDVVDKILPAVLDAALSGRAGLHAFENINLPLLATPGIDIDVLFQVHKVAGKTIDAQRVRPPYDTHEAALRTGGRVRVGYLSPDFRNHAVNTFFRGLINYRDQERFEVFCYSTSRTHDEISEQYKNAVDHFYNVSSLADPQIAELIHKDGIQILVDLAGYTVNSRTAVLSYRPAPLQIMYLGYPYTSGLAGVDYFVSDPYLDGPRNAAYFSEEQLRLPESFITFDSLVEQEISPVPPCAENGYITFGSLNNVYKINREVIALWSGVLLSVPGAKLIINHPNTELEDTRKNMLAEFVRHGVDESRVTFIWHKHPGGSHLRFYNDIDIILDTFPLTGGTTTIDAVWMGCPVITLVGDIYPQRLSYSVLSNVGLELDDLIAFTREEYLSKATALAMNSERIIELRSAIPTALQSSILCDPVRLTRHMESAYIRAWNNKFVDHVIDATAQNDAIEYQSVALGAKVAINGDLEDLCTYILKEQKGWFDPEYAFVLDFMQPGMNALDINAGHGIYSLPIAKKIAPSTMFAMTNTPRDGRYLQYGKTRSDINNMNILRQDERRFLLDNEMELFNGKVVDFVRANIQSSDTWVLRGSKEFFTKFSPLVLLNIKQAQGVLDVSLATTFRQWGYGIYRLVPGLAMIAPWEESEELDIFTLNLFACKDDRAATLEAAGRLVPCMENIEYFPGISDHDWVNYLQHMPYAGKYLSAWRTEMSQYPDWEAYWSALNLIARAKTPTFSAAQRWACLNASLNILLMLVKASPTIPRLLSCARVLAEVGKRAYAGQVLQQLLGILEGREMDPGGEPFLVPCAQYETVDPGVQFEQWVFAATLEQFERLRVFSSYFSGKDGLPLLEMLVGTGFATEAMARRLTLMKARYASAGGEG